MIREESKLDLPGPNAIEDEKIIILEGDIKEYWWFDDFSIFEVSDIEVKEDGIFGEGVDADR